MACLIALASLWPPLLNGGPFFMSDTPSYVRAADSGFFKLFGIQTGWTVEYLRLYQSAESAGAPAAAQTPIAVNSDDRPVTLKGRSVFYGVLLYMAQLAGTFWLVVIFQSLLAAACITLTVSGLTRVRGLQPKPGTALLAGLVVAAATPLGFFTGYLMPDVFGAFALLACANLLFLWKFQSRGVTGFWLALLLYALLVHSVNVLLVLAVSIAAAFYCLWRKLPLRRIQVAAVGACLVGALVGQAAFNQAVKSLTGVAPVRPPFIAMRLIADGPGYGYLKEHCPTEHTIYCRALSRPNPQSDTLLWSKNPQESLFRGLSPHEQRISAAQERHFVASVAADRPLQVLNVALANSVKQLTSFNLANFNYGAENQQRFRETVPPEIFAPLTRTRAYENSMPTRLIEMLSVLLALISVVVISAFLFSRRGDAALSPVRGYCLCILFGVLANAALCGALSGPKGRYAMRLIWVLPVVAAGVASVPLPRRRVGLT